jgi:hypothetical protein
VTQRGKRPIKSADYFQEHAGIHSDGVSVTQKYLLQIAVLFPRHPDILQYFILRAYPVLFILIHAAECALIMGTADCALKQITVRFTEWSEYIAFVSQNFHLAQ